MSSEIWTIKEMAAQFQCSTETIRRKVNSGELPPPNLGCIHSRGLKRWLSTDVLQFLREKKNQEKHLLKRAI